jgi:hypothetical protein
MCFFHLQEQGDSMTLFGFMSLMEGMPIDNDTKEELFKVMINCALPIIEDRTTFILIIAMVIMSSNSETVVHTCHTLLRQLDINIKYYVLIDSFHALPVTCWKPHHPVHHE